MSFVNYHSHKMYTNSLIADCPLSYNDYVDRVIELDQTVITSVEHGFQGNYWLLNEIIRKKNLEFYKRRKKGEENVPRDLKFVFGTEAYWVKDRHPKTVIDKNGKEKVVNDNSRCHIIILARSEFGRQEINYALSIANEDGMFGGVPRLDLELLMNLPENDVFITTACIGYWNKYEDIDDITLKLYSKFKSNFMLEVQNHDTPEQKELNKKILDISNKYGIDIICGLDTHVINTTSPKSDNDTKRRDKILEYKGIKYADEYGWNIDYPNVEEIKKRFKHQGVLTEEEINIAIKNTEVIETFDDIDLGLKTIINEDSAYLDVEIKVPSIHLDKTMEERDNILKDIINKEWKKYVKNEDIPKEEFPMYLEGIRYEIGEIIKCKMSDYFLVHYSAIEKGINKYGGKITKRGRGSGVSYFVNTLLGFSKVDRFKTPIKLYPERFITADRILKAKAMVDLDNNIDRQEPFLKAFREELGEHSTYPMLAFGALKKSSAIKLYMGAEGIEASIQNEVTKQLKEYDKTIKHCETDEEKDDINIADYIDKKYHRYIDESKPYQGIVVQKSQHPCAHLVINGDIRREIGLFRCESESTKKSVLTACIEGVMADHYCYCKSDLLIVDVVGLTEAIWERIGEPSPSNTKLEKMLTTDKGDKAWEMYEKGYTLCVNQCEQEGTKNKCKRYKMRNTAELASFVSAVRPGFSSQLGNFLDREPYSNGVDELDELFSDSQRYILFQENIMGFLSWLGIDMKETYEIVKKISKKVYTDNPEQMEELKNRCRPMWIKHVGTEEGFDRIFKVVELSGAYIFNASHAYCVGNDGAEIAYCKSNYPYETYEVCLNWFTAKKKKDKISALKEEMKLGFGIDEGDIKWGLDNTKFTLDKENKCIHPSLSSLKSMGKNVAEELYLASKEHDFNSFYEVLKYIKTKTSTNATMLNILVRIDYFKDFAKAKKVHEYIYYYDLLEGMKSPKKSTISEKVKDLNVLNLIERHSTPTAATYTKFNSEQCLKEIWDTIPNRDFSVQEKILDKKDMLGYVSYKNDQLDKRYILITEFDDKYSVVVNTYCLNNGKTCKCKISKKLFREKIISADSFIYINKMERKLKSKKVGNDENGKPIFEKTNEYEWWITDYSIIKDLDEVLEG